MDENTLVEETNAVNQETETVQDDTTSGFDEVGTDNTQSENGELELVELPVEEVATPTDTNTQVDAAKKHTPTQSEMDIAIGKRLDYERRLQAKKYEATDEYSLGAMLIRERAEQEGITPSEARKRIEQEHMAKRAKALAANPEELAKQVLRSQYQTAPQPADPVQEQARTIAAQLQTAHEAGLVPENFDVQSMTDTDKREFATTAKQRGITEALKEWSVKHPIFNQRTAVEQELVRRQAGATPINPSSTVPSERNIDFRKLSDKDWAKIQAKVKQAEFEGKAVKFI